MVTGRYDGMPVDRLSCPFCEWPTEHDIEHEVDVLLECGMNNKKNNSDLSFSQNIKKVKVTVISLLK